MLVNAKLYVTDLFCKTVFFAARVFNQKRKTLIKAITDGLFGNVLCYMLSIEWQKRGKINKCCNFQQINNTFSHLGLPHQHMLVWLEEDIHPRIMDQVISAEIPDPEKDPELYKVVTTWMLHGPCSSKRCLQDGKCNKNFPKPFMAETRSDKDGYPLYRRRKPGEGGQEISITRASGAIHVYNNRDVVAYNPALCRIYDCHINVEYVASISAIKYVCKYVNKGMEVIEIFKYLLIGSF